MADKKTAVASGAKKGKKTTIRKKKTKFGFTEGVAHIHATFNNTIVSISDQSGHVVAWASAGTVGFSGAKRSTAYAAQLAAQSVAKTCLDRGLKKVAVEVKGPGQGRESAMRALASAGLTITSIADVTPVPHNGCRPPKKPRG